MLKKEEEFEQNGVMTGQTLTNDLYGKRKDSEAACYDDTSDFQGIRIR